MDTIFGGGQNRFKTVLTGRLPVNCGAGGTTVRNVHLVRAGGKATELDIHRVTANFWQDLPIDAQSVAIHRNLNGKRYAEIERH